MEDIQAKYRIGDNFFNNQVKGGMGPYLTIHWGSGTIKKLRTPVLEAHREAIALPGEPLGVTHCAEHHIKLKLGTNPVYINAYKLTHSQRELVLEIIKVILEQGLILKSSFPWKSPLFFWCSKRVAHLVQS